MCSLATVSPADKLRHKGVLGFMQISHRVPTCSDAPLTSDYNLIGYFDGFLLIVRHKMLVTPKREMV